MTEPQTEPARRPTQLGWRTLSRRVRGLVVGAVFFVVLLALLMALPVPYVILSPGPTINTLGKYNDQQLIQISGTPVNRTTGNLNLTTVNVTTDSHRITALNALVGWLAHDQVVVPKASIYPPGQSTQQIEQQNRTDFSSSQNSAIAAASCELGYPKQDGVVSVLAGQASDGKLEAGDVIKQVNGQATPDNKALLTVLEGLQPNTTVPVVITRQRTQQKVQITLGRPSGRKGAALGVEIGTICQPPFSVSMAQTDIGGPSAGMMFALGILDLVGHDDLTDGRFIAGTGTIDPAGTVGPIGGIQMKMIAARRAGATVFLAPQANCPDVRGNVPSGLTVVKVDTLRSAVQDLDALEQGKSVPSC